MGDIGVTWRFKIAASFSSNIQDGSHDGNLETLQTSDSELLKVIGSDSQDVTYYDQPIPGERFLAHLGL